MTLPRGESGRANLVYCLNVFPDDSPREHLDRIFPSCRELADNLFGSGHPMKLGFRFGQDSLGAANDSDTFIELKQKMADLSLSGMTFNAFPFGVFHGERVKENVYAPDWRTPERLEYTCRAADFLAATLTDGEGSISTLPGSYAAWMNAKSDESLIIRRLVDAVIYLHTLAEKLGTVIHLGLEPEPDGWLQTTDEFCHFVKDRMWLEGADLLAEDVGCSKATAQKIIQRHLGICFDTCHMAIQFESLSDSVRRLNAEGIRISKVHLSAALEVTPDFESLTKLEAFDEPVYLHQVRAKTVDGEISGWPDLGPGLEGLKNQSAERARIHFHVPLHWTGSDGLRSTVTCMDDAFFEAMRESNCRHYEVETYTFGVLPGDLKEDRLETQILREMQWAHDRLLSAGIAHDGFKVG